MMQVWAEKDSEWYEILIHDGWINWCDYVDEHGLALMVKNLNADPKDKE